MVEQLFSKMAEQLLHSTALSETVLRPFELQTWNLQFTTLLTQETPHKIS